MEPKESLISLVINVTIKRVLLVSIKINIKR